MPDLDFEGASKAHAENLPADGLKQLQALVDEADTLDKHIDELEKMRQSAAGRYNYIKTELLPQLMATLQTGSWTNANGTKVELGNYVAGEIPKDPVGNAAMVKYLEANGGGPLLKTQIEIEFKKSQHNEALALADDIRKRGYEPVVTSGIHHQTLLGYARERLSKGENINLKVLGLYATNVARITHAGKTKATKASTAKKSKTPKAPA